MQRRTMGLLLAVCMLSAFTGGVIGSFLFPDGKVLAATDALPPELFERGELVNGMGATYLIEGVRGGWIQVRLYRTLDQHKAPPDAPRWIYVPGIDSVWSKAKKGDSRVDQ